MVLNHATIGFFPTCHDSPFRTVFGGGLWVVLNHATIGFFLTCHDSPFCRSIKLVIEKLHL